jgi:hypothetical protein
MEDKYEQIYLYSDPDIVLTKAMQIYGKDVMLGISLRKDKKYTIYNPHKDEWFHFGSWGQEDYTKHKDDKRKQRFIIRNHRWKNQDKYALYRINNICLGIKLPGLLSWMNE